MSKTGRQLAVGDIHGCFNALKTLIEFVGVTKDDTLITLGDYVDRGPDSCAVIDWLIWADQHFQLVPLRGNHDVMMVKAREEGPKYRDWLKCGGETTLDSYSPFPGVPGKFVDVPDQHWEFLEHRLQRFHETDHHFFVHANVHPSLPLEEQPDYLLYWQQLIESTRHCSGKIMVCGHSSQRSGRPLVTESAICIDTWVYGAGWLSCLDIDSGDVWQANEAGETRTLRVDVDEQQFFDNPEL